MNRVEVFATSLSSVKSFCVREHKTGYLLKFVFANTKLIYGERRSAAGKGGRSTCSRTQGTLAFEKTQKRGLLRVEKHLKAHFESLPMQ